MKPIVAWTILVPIILAFGVVAYLPGVIEMSDLPEKALADVSSTPAVHFMPPINVQPTLECLSPITAGRINCVLTLFNADTVPAFIPTMSDESGFGLDTDRMWPPWGAWFLQVGNPNERFYEQALFDRTCFPLDFTISGLVRAGMLIAVPPSESLRFNVVEDVPMPVFASGEYLIRMEFRPSLGWETFSKKVMAPGSATSIWSQPLFTNTVPVTMTR